MRLFAVLVALALTSCKKQPPESTAPAPSPPPPAQAEPPAAAPEPIATTVEPPASEPVACKCPADPGAGVPAAPASPSETAEAGELDDDPDRKARLARARKTIAKPLAARLAKELPGLKPACDVVLDGPCSVRGEFDGDALRDDVVLVRDDQGAAGLAFLWGKGGAEQLGAGRRGQCWARTELPYIADEDGVTEPPPPERCPEEIDGDLGWLHSWALRPREVQKDGPMLVDRGRRRQFSAAGAVGDGLQVSGGDAAVMLYRRADGWVLMDLGF